MCTKLIKKNHSSIHRVIWVSVLELGKLLKYKLYYKCLELYWTPHAITYMDTFNFVCSLNANNQQLTNVLEQSNNDLDLSELNKSHELIILLPKKLYEN